MTVKYENGSVEFSEVTGEMLSYKRNGVSILNKTPVSHKGFMLNLARAYLDNDADVTLKMWKEQNLANPKIEINDISAEVKSGIATVSQYLTVYGAEEPIFDAHILYIIGGNGVIDIEVAIKRTIEGEKVLTSVPRIGLTVELDKKITDENVNYLKNRILEETRNYNQDKIELLEKVKDYFCEEDAQYIKCM